MELIKKHWTKQDVAVFQAYLKSLSKGVKKSEWESKIVNTKLPCLAVPAQKVKDISKQIVKGNYIEFLDLWIWQTHTNTLIIGELICKIKDFNTFKMYLDKYALMCDNWATCDALKFNVTAQNKSQFYNLCLSYVKSPLPFVKRIGIRILFKFLTDDYIDKVFNIVASLKNETEYYVNMANAWLLTECFIKQRDKTLEFLKHNNLNKFTINMTVSKCRDSLRVSKEDKILLNNFKIK